MVTTCYAKDCSHRRNQNFRLFRFPSDERRRHIWKINCGRINIAKHARLCEYHFDDNQFENNRRDGWRKLKPNAVPTIFNSPLMKLTDTTNDNLLTGEATNQVERPQTIPHVTSENLNQLTNDSNDIYIDNYSIKLEIDEDVSSENMHLSSGMIDRGIQTDDIILQTRHMSDKNGSIRQENEIKHLRVQLQKIQLKNKNLKSHIKIIQLRNVNRGREIKILEAENKRLRLLETRMEEIPVFKAFIRGFNNSTREWSSQCIKLAMEIRSAVGWRAYLYICKELGLPLPSYSTICRHSSEADANSSPHGNVKFRRQ